MLEWDISYADACFLCCCFGCFSLFLGGKAPSGSGFLGQEGCGRRQESWQSCRGSLCWGCTQQAWLLPEIFPVHPAGAWDASCMWDRAVR